jgi:hypothetical protein
MEPSETGSVLGHEAIGVVEAVGADVRTLKAGDVVVMPFAFSDGTCVFCHEGLHTSCVHGGFFGNAPARAYIEELLPDILEGRIHPGRVFDHWPRRRAGRLPGDRPTGSDQGHGRAMSATGQARNSTRSQQRTSWRSPPHGTTGHCENL